MPIDFDAVLQSEKARDSLYDLWYEALQEEANDVLIIFTGGGMCSGENRVVEWNEMYFFLGDDYQVEEGPFNSLEDTLPLVESCWRLWTVESLKSDVLPLERLLRIARGLVESEGDKVHINDKWFILSGAELVEEPPTRR